MKRASTYRNIAMFTDIHWGAKGNSHQHNADCLDYIHWFVDRVKARGCDAIVFMGDWYENRNAINITTMNASYDGLAVLNALDLPIYFCIGNHDLYHRENRNTFSTYPYGQFENVELINEPLHVGDMSFYPFLFKSEYPAAAAELVKNKPRYVFGHFEFRNFVITGADRRMEHGPDHKNFAGPEYIFSGHFHKRQANDNIIYIGNTFPTNYGDAGDDARGAAFLDTVSNEVDFEDWKDCPKYRKIRLSELLEIGAEIPAKCRVRCTIDVDIAYSEAQTLKEEFTKGLKLREFSLEENLLEKKEAIAGNEELEEFEMTSLNDAVIKMLSTGITGTTSIEPQRLIDIYDRL